MKRFQGGLVFQAHRLLYHSTLGLRVMKKKKKFTCCLGSGVSGLEWGGWGSRFVIWGRGIDGVQGVGFKGIEGSEFKMRD